MQIIYMHHAEREIGDDPINDDITERGIKEALILRDRLVNKKISAIISSPYLRCRHTSEIIKGSKDIEIIYDERLNEKNKAESKSEFLKRNIECIDEIISKYDNDACVICMTSGVNLTAFICYFYGVEVNDEISYSQAGAISPVIFTCNGSNVD